MNDQPTPEDWAAAIATFQESYRQLLRLGTHLLESGKDLTAVSDLIDGLTESQAKGLLKVSVAGDASDYAETRRQSKLN